MTDHTFSKGDRVHVAAEWAVHHHSKLVFEVIEFLPHDGSSPRYLVKSATEAFSRVALEDNMTAVEA